MNEEEKILIDENNKIEECNEKDLLDRMKNPRLLLFSCPSGVELEYELFLQHWKLADNIWRVHTTYGSVYQALMAAMHKRTSIGCESKCNEALELCHNNAKLKKYVQDQWVNTREEWALYKRYHSPLLLQITTTNAVESWHSCLKNPTSTYRKLTKQSGFEGVLYMVNQVTEDRWGTLRKQKLDWASKELKICSIYKPMRNLPKPVQQLVFTEYVAAQNQLEWLQDIEDVKAQVMIFQKKHGVFRHSCQCLFYMKYYLPCRHLFLVDLAAEDGSYLTSRFWKLYLDGWEESGMEIYHKYEAIVVETPEETEESKAKKDILFKSLSILEQGKQLLFLTH
jgi:hypothetical protein